jgi:hypothetical protein
MRENSLTYQSRTNKKMKNNKNISNRWKGARITFMMNV